MVTFALAGFADFGSVAIQTGALGALVPERHPAGVGQRGLRRDLLGNSQNVEVASGGQVSRAGARRGVKPHGQFRVDLLGLAVASVLALAAWVFLVWSAIEFGRSARGGEERAWWFLGMASLGAVVCLFLALLLCARLLREIGILETTRPHKH